MSDRYTLCLGKKAAILNDGNGFSLGNIVPLLWKRISETMFSLVYEHGDVKAYDLVLSLELLAYF